MRNFILFPLLVSIAMPALAVSEAVDSSWAVAANPYRVRLKLDRSISGPTAIELDPQLIIDRVAQVAVDHVNQETFAFEKAVLVHPRTGKIVGRFQLVRTDAPLDIDGSFAGLKKGKSPWAGFSPDKMTFESIRLGGASHNALMIVEKSIMNVKLQQTVQLTDDQCYLLEYWIMMDPKDNEMGVMISTPKRALFAELQHSYYNKMPPRGEWAHRRVIFRPKVLEAQLEVRPTPSDAYLQVSHAFTGRGGVADIRLQPVAWQLIVDPDEPTDALDLYVMARAGHRLTVPTDELIASSPPQNRVTAAVEEAQVQSLNPDAVIVSDGSVTAWTVDPVLPMKVGAIRGYRPAKAQAVKAARVDAFRGGSASLVVAVDANRPRLGNLRIESDLPVDVAFHRLATVPVYDGPTVDGVVKGNFIETRYDPMVPLGFSLDPDSEDGLHLIVATITPRNDTPAGKHRGNVTLAFDETTLVVPVDLRVAPMTIAPKRHFGTLFGGDQFLVSLQKGVAGLTEDSIPVAEFHGLRGDGLSPKRIVDLSIPDKPDSRTLNVRALAERYFHVMLDNHVLPESPALYAYFSYDVVDQGEGLAPKLANWDFTGGFDESIKEFVIGRDMPWLMIGRTNGDLISRIQLSNGVTYSINPNPDDPSWVHLSHEQFDQLIGDYWDALARHLDDLGVLDRAIFVIDESGPGTYDDIYAHVMAMRSRPFAKQIKIGHTTYNASAWTHRLPNGKLLMDEVLDVPMPTNDDHFNFFEPEWNARYKRPGKISWVYQVETDHLDLQDAGLSTILMPLKLQHFEVKGWYCWASFIWSLPYSYLEGERGGFKYGTGPVMNPWVNPFYHHGPGVLSFFYPPDPRGVPSTPTDLVIPSYRLTLMRDGIQMLALTEELQANGDKQKLKAIESQMSLLWADNPVQWYLSYNPFHKARRQIHDLAMESLTHENP